MFLVSKPSVLAVLLVSRNCWEGSGSHNSINVAQHPGTHPGAEPRFLIPANQSAARNNCFSYHCTPVPPSRQFRGWDPRGRRARQAYRSQAVSYPYSRFRKIVREDRSCAFSFLNLSGNLLLTPASPARPLHAFVINDLPDASSPNLTSGAQLTTFHLRLMANQCIGGTGWPCIH